MKADYLLGVADVSRLGALRLRNAEEETFQLRVSPGADRNLFLVA